MSTFVRKLIYLRNILIFNVLQNTKSQQKPLLATEKSIANKAFFEKF